MTVFDRVPAGDVVVGDRIEWVRYPATVLAVRPTRTFTYRRRPDLRMDLDVEGFGVRTGLHYFADEWVRRVHDAAADDVDG